ncbi:unnamed protein product [Effrenium voratum]|nr:unnamed protein product [Effrenium voratum]|mmetsp:Transcript_38916/g.93050  ORF Transcript_38916/g.93050 Transcript_38916/m.93050 type:complete len:330 (-) Transcript_38916:179-1168(-)
MSPMVTEAMLKAVTAYTSVQAVTPELGVSSPMWSDDQEDQLDRNGVADERIEQLKEREMGPLLFPSSFSLPPGLRPLLLRLLFIATAQRRMTQSIWSLAVTIMNTYLSRISQEGVSTDVIIGMLPAKCIAILRLAWKHDGSSRGHDHDSWVPNLIKLEQYMQSLGYRVTPDMTKRTLEDHEKDVLFHLNWTLDLPFVEKWLALYWPRLNILTKYAHQDIVSCMEQQMMRLAQVLAMAAGDLRARDVSLALFCLALHWAKLLPSQFCVDSKSQQVKAGFQVQMTTWEGSEALTTAEVELVAMASLEEITSATDLVLNGLAEGASRNHHQV